MERQKEFVLRTLEERDIRFVRLWFTDVLGTLKSVSVAPAELESAFEEGIGFDGSAIEGFARVYESDMVAMPDPTTFQVFPFEGRGIGESARMFCDILTPEGAPSWADPRHVLRRSLSKAADRGFTFYVHPEIEFFLLKDGSEHPEPVDEGGYFDHTTHSVARDFRRQAILALERVGISVEFSHHEVAPGQQEIDLRYADALTTADNIMTFRHIVKEVALTSGVHASFMPKPFSDQPGSGMHSHMSLFEGEDNAFHDPGDEQRLSKTAKAFIAGLLRHAPEFTAITCQWVNSYKRLYSSPQPGQISEAPSYVAWGKANRSALVRVPAYGKPNSARVEIRSLDSAVNPYLAYAVMLGAGLKGIEEGYELSPGTEDDVSALTNAERVAAGYQPLPSSLAEALDAMESSELVPEVLGEHVFDYFLKNKRSEWEDYRTQVTPFERRRYINL
ncbi:glutamine synthetase family protein [Glycomyces sp. L485]|uniref:glutamine synthetase family protein n=1 Tax=Glycomyces sp. L485 TaxID=2909235 RepID=UPI001F4B95DF|nr:glutamine synthetase family protein [Glycomyces sp. L485]MCH7230764.1 glutamine synthetase family protein [Glycomyces sp. L485]